MNSIESPQQATVQLHRPGLFSADMIEKESNSNESKLFGFRIGNTYLWKIKGNEYSSIMEGTVEAYSPSGKRVKFDSGWQELSGVEVVEQLTVRSKDEIVISPKAMRNEIAIQILLGLLRDRNFVGSAAQSAVRIADELIQELHDKGVE